MKDAKKAVKIIHVSEIDSFLAECLVQEGDSAYRFNVSKKDYQGNISIDNLGKAEWISGDEPVDFELSTGESLNPELEDIAQYTEKPVYTSSAYEFFDFLLASLSSFGCVAEFAGNAWRIKIENPATRSDKKHI